ERRLVEEAYIDERVLIREARALGLEADERIDDILVQKMLHILSGDVIQPTDEELARFYEANRERYTTDASVTVDELVLPFGGPFPRQIREGVQPEDLPDSVRIAYRLMEDLTRDDLAQLFGEDAARTALAMEGGAWVQASVSPRGEHWLRVRARAGSVLPPLEVVWDQVRADWITQQEQVRLLERVAELRSHYTVEVEDR
ncbi:MAG TPA: peptidylprolyl isomerase, partial [Longimicrobiales bacterium]|nr:peptidylprolyl isomerase [Longimicrobiales bacterium]